MRKHLVAASIAAVALLPSLARAQETCEQRSANRAAGTALGAVAGALLGSAVAGHGEKGTGAIIGGVGGAVIGNQASRGPRDCAHAYGYYDNDGRWHDNRVDRSVAYGYYDREGVWVDGPPPNVAGYSANAAYVGREAMSIDARIARLDERIQRSRSDGSLSRRESKDAERTLNDIRHDEINRASGGILTDRDRSELEARLDRLAAQIHYDREG